jgi:hypothetical protein
MPEPRGNKTTARNLEENEAQGRRDMAGKAERVTVKRCGKQLRYKFDRGEDVLDYFDLSKARVVRPQSRMRLKKIGLFGKGRFASTCDGSREISALSEEEIAKSFR